MKLLPAITLSLVLSILALPVLAARLEVPEELIIVAVDGKDLGLQLFNTKDHVDLSVGAHRIAVKYKDLYELGGDQHEVVASEPVLLAFAVAEEGSYRFSFTRPETVEAARRFAAEPQFGIIGPNGQTVESRMLTQDQQQSLWVESLGLDNSRSEAVKATAMPVAQTAVATPRVTAETKAATTTGEQQMAAEQLRYWWSKADAQTRQAFLSQILSKP